MKKNLILGVVVFVLSLAGGTGVAIIRAPAAVPADSTAVQDTTAASDPDSVAKDEEREASSELRGAGEEERGTESGEPGAGGEGHVTATAGERVDSLPGLPSPEASPEERKRAYAQMARILGAMKAADAGRILARLNDDQVQGLLQEVSVRQAAAMMAMLPPERAAEMSRRMLTITVRGN